MKKQNLRYPCRYAKASSSSLFKAEELFEDTQYSPYSRAIGDSQDASTRDRPKSYFSNFSAVLANDLDLSNSSKIFL